MPDVLKDRKKEIFIHADLMGNRPSCQNPKAELSSGFGIRGFSWWKTAPVLCSPHSVMLMGEGLGAGKPAPRFP